MPYNNESPHFINTLDTHLTINSAHLNWNMSAGIKLNQGIIKKTERNS